jgi:hypothetical protein
LLNVNREVKTEIMLRWWAIPADGKPPTAAEPIVVDVEFGVEGSDSHFVPQDNFSIEDTARVRVTHTNTNPPEDRVRVKLTVGLPSDAIIDLTRAVTERNVFTSEVFRILPEGIALEGEDPRSLAVPGLKDGVDLVAVYLDKENNEIASGTAHIVRNE